MRNERFYHSAQSAAESNVDAGRGAIPAGNAVALFERIFPQALEVSAYTLRKRLLCPRWWLTGVMTQWLTKDTDLVVAQLGLREGDFVLSGPQLNAKTFPLIVSLWTELMSQLTTENAAGTSVELNIGRIIKGTALEMEQQREFLTTYLSSALRIQRLISSPGRVSSRRTKSVQSPGSGFALESVGLVQVVENVVMTDSSRQKLCVTFARDPRKLFALDVTELLPLPLLDNAKIAQGLSECGNGIVTLQPDVLRAMSRSLSPKKLIPYFLLEMLKIEKPATDDAEGNLSGSVWRGRSLGQRELAQTHKEQLAQARALYDHGLLSWENEAPRQRVRTLIDDSKGLPGNSGIVHCWRLSQHAVDAVQFEQAMSSFLRNTDSSRSAELSAPAPRLSLPQAGVESAAVQVKQVELSARTAQKVPPAGADFPLQDSPATKHSADVGRISATSERTIVSHAVHSGLNFSGSQKPAPKPAARPLREACEGSGTVWSDDEFLMCVAEFYESLTPAQQQAFERERRRMTPEQFRIYVTPALMRHKIKSV
ncbi:MAG: hypothetical protein FJY29_09360 [Betaproteobacteria bacterium]|nr:hypothetical protein [Betaproteobacteria bacterium]